MLIDKKIIVATAISLASGFAMGNYIGKIRAVNEMFVSIMSGFSEAIKSNRNHKIEEES